MKTLTALMLVHLIVTSGLSQNRTVEATIRDLELREHKAMLAQDVPSLQKYWATDFVVNTPFNMITTSSQELVNLVKNGKIHYSSFTREIERIFIKGDVVTTMGHEEVVPVAGANAGQTVKRRFTNIWIKQNGTWKLTIRHANEIL